MSNITHELQKLKENFKDYLADKADIFVTKVSNIYDGIKQTLKSKSQDVQDKCAENQKSIESAIEDLKSVSENNKEKAYNTILEKLKKLNDKIESNTSK